MVFIINSMPKAASSLLRFYIRSIIDIVNPANQLKVVSMIKNGYILGKGQFVTKVDQKLLDTLLNLSTDNGPVMIKVHLSYSQEIAQMLTNPDVIHIYNYRDPRDVVLSAMDHAQRAQKNGSNEFSDCLSFESSVTTVLRWSNEAVRWLQSKTVLPVFYEEFISNPLKVLKQLCSKAHLDISETDLDKVLNQEKKLRSYGLNQFNKGLLKRYTIEMNEDQIWYCNQIFHEVLPLLSVIYQNN